MMGKTQKRYGALLLQLLSLVACSEESQREVFLHPDKSLVQYRLLILLAGIEMTLGRDAEAAQLIPWDVGSEYAVKLAKEGDYTKARLYFSEALKKAEEFGPQDPRLAKSLENLASFYQNQAKFAETESEALLKYVVAIYEERHDPGLTASLNNLAGLYQRRGRFAEAETLFKRVLTIRSEKLGLSHFDVILTQNNLASLYIVQHRFPEAEKILKDSIEATKKNNGPVPLMVALLENYASVLQALQRNDEAETIIRQFSRLQNGASIKDMGNLG